MKPIRATVMIDELIAAKTRVAELTEKVVASLTEAAGKLGFTLVPGGAHPLTDGPIALASSDPDVTRALTRGRLTPREHNAVLEAKKKPAPLKCGYCGRTFALPLHLGRHMTATHKVHPGGRSVSRHSAQRRGAVRVVVDHKTTPRSRQGR